MNGPLFRIRILTPLSSLERMARSLRLSDGSGHFGIMKGHADFLTTLLPSLGYYTDREGEEMFIAVDGGVLSVRDGEVTLATRNVYESRDAGSLREIIEGSILRKEKVEEAYTRMVRGLEKAYLEKSIQQERGRM